MNQLFKILVKEEGKELELKAFDTEAEDEIDLAYKHYYIVSDIIKTGMELIKLYLQIA